MGLPVYDSDSRAKALMDSSPTIKQAISDSISAAVIRRDGSIDRKALAVIVFSDRKALDKLNGIVHAAVRADIEKFRTESAGSLVFVETAILYQSGIDRMAAEVWEVTAPEELRVRRVMKRNGIGEEEVRARMESQRFCPVDVHPNVKEIVNDGVRPVLPAVTELLRAAQRTYRSDGMV